MRPFHHNDKPGLQDPRRLETPTMAGYRNGLSTTGVIGRKLSAVYEVEGDLPDDMRDALQELSAKLAGPAPNKPGA